MALTFTKATKAKAKARIALYGPSGGGKTYSALSIATGMRGDARIALIDTEHAAASKYSDRFDFDTLTLKDPRVEDIVEALKVAEAMGYSVVVIDSLTHAWQKLLEEVDASAKASRTGNSFAAWRDHTPRQKKLVDAILSSPCHVIATIRAKTEWAQETNDRGKLTPRRVGLTPEQGKGIEFEFDLLISINADHYATVEKDRSGKFQDKVIEKPGVEFGKELAAWLSDGVDAPPTPANATQARDVVTPAIDTATARNSLITAVEGFTGIARNDPAFPVEIGRVMKWLDLPGKVRDMDAATLTDAATRLAQAVANNQLFADVPAAD